MTFETVIWVYIGGVILGAAVVAFGQGAGFWDVFKHMSDGSYWVGAVTFSLIFWPLMAFTAALGLSVYVPLWLCMKLGEYAARRCQ